MTRGISYITIVLLVVISSCIESYDPEITKYEDLLVVDGKISNEAGPQKVILSISSDVHHPEIIPVENAEVQIFDNLGNTLLLNEVDPGEYHTDSMVSGIVGRSYGIEIKREDGQTYRSELEELKNPVGISDVYQEIEILEFPEENDNLYGYRFYIDTELAEDKENYYLWDLEATYQYQSDFTIRWYFDGELHWFHGPDSLYNCWSTKKIQQIFVARTLDLIKPQLIKYPFHFVSTRTRELSVKYSLLVKQLSISKDAFTFWDDIQSQNGNTGGLYSTLPHMIKGNLTNIDAPEEPVLGYFMVAGVSEKRIVVDKPLDIPMQYVVCRLTEADFEAYGQMGMMDPVIYPLYAIETPGGRRALPHQNCVDCRRKGGTIKKPEYWID